MRVPVPAGRGPGHWQLPSARQDAERARRARPGTHGGCASWHARRVRVLARTAGARPGTHGGCASWHARRVRVLARTAGARPGTHGACASWHARRVRVLARTARARPGTHGGGAWHPDHTDLCGIRKRTEGDLRWTDRLSEAPAAASNRHGV